MRLCLVAACTTVVLWWAGAALAGGTQVSVVAVAGRVWVTTGFDVVKLDATSGRVMRRSRARYPFALEIGASDGSIWVSSVQNGFVSGALTRIPFEAGAVTHPLVLPSRPILALAVGSGTTWALIGPWPNESLAAVDQATGKTSLTRLRERIGWIAADNAGATRGLFGITTGGRAVRLGRDGHVLWRARTEPIESPPAAGLGKLWAAGRRGLYRIDPRQGHVEGTLAVASDSVQLAVGGGYVWMLALHQSTSGSRYVLLEINPHTLQVVKRSTLAGPIDDVSYGNGFLWLGRDTPTVSVTRVNPSTLRQRLFASNLG